MSQSVIQVPPSHNHLHPVRCKRYNEDLSGGEIGKVIYGHPVLVIGWVSRVRTHRDLIGPANRQAPPGKTERPVDISPDVYNRWLRLALASDGVGLWPAAAQH